MLCDPVSGLPIVTVSTLSGSGAIDPFLLPLATHSYVGGGGRTDGALMSSSIGTGSQGAGGMPPPPSSSSPMAPTSPGRKRGVSFAPGAPAAASFVGTVALQQGTNNESVPLGRRRGLSFMTADTRGSSGGGGMSPRGGGGGGGGGGGAMEDSNSAAQNDGATLQAQQRPQSIFDWLSCCLPMVRIPGAPTRMISAADDLMSSSSRHHHQHHPILLYCTPALKLPQHDVGKIGYKRRLVVCTRDELLVFREDGLMKLRLSWGVIQTVQHIPVSTRLPDRSNCELAATTGNTAVSMQLNASSSSTFSVAHVVLFNTNALSRDAGLVFRSAQDAQALINIAVIRKRQLLAAQVLDGRVEEADDRMGELKVLRRDLSEPPITASQLQAYLTSAGVVALKRPSNLAPLPSTIPTIELLKASTDVGGAGSGSGGAAVAGGGVLFQAISELQREADRCKQETAAAATATHWSLLGQYRDALNYAYDRKVELDSTRIGYLKQKSTNDSHLSKVKGDLAGAREELRSVSQSLLSTRDGHDNRIAKLREECHSSEERSKNIVMDTSSDEIYLADRRRRALGDRDRLTAEVNELQDILESFKQESSSYATAEEKEANVKHLEAELKAMLHTTSLMREETGAIKFRINHGGALTKLTTSTTATNVSQRKASGSPQHVRDVPYSPRRGGDGSPREGVLPSDVALRFAGDGVEVSDVFFVPDVDDHGVDGQQHIAVDILELNEDGGAETLTDVNLSHALRILEQEIEKALHERTTLESAVFGSRLALRNAKVLLNKQKHASEKLADDVHQQRLRNSTIADKKRVLEQEVDNLEKRVGLFSMETMIVDDARREAHLHASIADTVSRSFDFGGDLEATTNAFGPLYQSVTSQVGANRTRNTMNNHSKFSMPTLAEIGIMGAEDVEGNGPSVVSSQLDHLRRIKERLQRTVDASM